MLENYMARDSYKHFCYSSRGLQVADRCTFCTDDTLVVVSGKFYKVLDIDSDGGDLTMAEIQTEEYSMASLEVDVPWSLVGVYKYLGRANHTIQVDKSSVCGKGIKVGGFILEFHQRWMTM